MMVKVSLTTKKLPQKPGFTIRNDGFW